MRKLTTRTAVVATAAVALSGVGVAFAAWTTAGSGNAAASTAKSRGTLSVTPGAIAADAIYPTATFNNVVTVANSNPYAVKLSSVTVSGATATGQCGTDLLALNGGNGVFSGTQATTTKLNTASPSTTVTVPVTVSNDIPDSCVATPITLAFTASGASDNQ